MSVRKSFEEGLANLREDLLRLGHLTTEAVALSVDALKRQDVELAEKVIAGDDPIDRLHLEIQNRCMELIATQQPMAGDLRVIGAAMVIGIDLERVADHAEGVASAAIRLSRQPMLKPLIDVPRMAEVVQVMLKEALDAFVERDVQKARQVAQQDDEVDGLRSQVFRELLTYMMEDARNISRAMELILVTQHLERMGDHATNIAERIIYMVTGDLRDLNV
ncbi:MAG TPA: phosphate signaling complex protein PhoU [Firmicutes bacterium]|nr:phosphate signaling complex protein PhoU [Bacillota bacterium]